MHIAGGTRLTGSLLQSQLRHGSLRGAARCHASDRKRGSVGSQRRGGDLTRHVRLMPPVPAQATCALVEVV